MTRLRTIGYGVLAGLAAAAGAVGASALAALPLDGVSPVISLGDLVIELTPGPLKDFAVATFGEYDKPVLLGSVLTVMAVLAALTGVLAVRRPRRGLLAGVALNVIALAAALDTGGLSAATVMPGVVALLVSTVLLAAFIRGTGGDWRATRGPQVGQVNRRVFLLATGAGGVLGAAGGVAGGTLPRAGEASRARITLPAPADPAPPLPAGTALEVDGISRHLTRTKDFYRVDTRLQLPQIDAERWRLRIHGLVERELDFGYRDLLAMPLTERRFTLTCVSNQVGDEYAGNATWLGVKLKDLLERAGVRPGADAVKSTDVAGMTIGTPLAALRDDREALLALGMNGEPLPVRHGFPARMVVPGLYGYVSATKWVTDLEVTRFADFTAYWTQRDWAEQAPIKTMTRIDVPKPYARARAGTVVNFAGVAWAQRRGVERVEVQVDDGPWQPARLAEEDSIDTWRQWVFPWTAEGRGTHRIQVRATDGQGRTQTSRRVPPRPDGATGWHSVIVVVR